MQKLQVPFSGKFCTYLIPVLPGRKLSHERLDYASLFVPLKKWPVSAVEISIL